MGNSNKGFTVITTETEGIYKCIGTDEYIVDTWNKTCSCKAWYYSKKKDKKGNKTCKHLEVCKNLK